jgi:signal peptidase I
LQEEVGHREAADQALNNGMSRLQMAWNKIALSVFSLVNLANKSSFTQSDTTTEWASDSDGKALVADETFSSYKPTEMVISFDYSYTTYPWRGNQIIVVYGFINGSSSRSFDVLVNIASNGSATTTVVTGGSNIGAEVSTNDKTGHVNVYVRNSGAVISSAHVRISPRWGVITIGNIIVADTDESHAFRRTGIDVIDGLIDLRADRVIFSNSDGTVSGKVSIDATKGTLITQDAVLRGNLYLPYLRLTNLNINNYTITNFYGQTVINLESAGNNLQVEVDNVTIRLPRITADMLGCEINIFNATDGTIEINGSGATGSSASGAYFCNLLVPSLATDLDTNSIVTLQKFREIKVKAFYHGQGGGEAYNYGWLVCYANINP